MTLIKDAVIVGVITNPSKEKIEVYGWAYYYVYAIYFPLFFVFGYYVFLRKCLKANGNIRMQLLNIVIGMIAGSIPAVIVAILLPVLGNHEFLWTGPLWTVFWVVGVYLAITKYHLLNLQTTNIFKPQ